jgi:hypothetical protein
LALRSTLRRKRKAAQRDAAELRQARNNLWNRLLFWPAFRALPVTVMLFVPIIVTKASGLSWQELLDFFTVAFIMIYAIIAFLSMLSLASEKKWLRRRS